jgi:hypothetical protein
MSVLTNTNNTKIWLLAASLCSAVFFLAVSQAGAAGLNHLIPTEDAFDCYACHKIATPKVAQDWYESKHGVGLMKCFVCHGQPDGKGSVPWTVNPDPKEVCQKCHDPAMKRMEAKYGINPDCNRCHPFHHNSLHHGAYKKTESKKQ